MLDGVIELNKTSYVSSAIDSGFGIAIILITCFIFAISLFLAINEIRKNSTKKIAHFALAFLALLIVCFSLYSLVKNGRQLDAIECTLDDSVPFLELTEHYEILDQRGQIYTLHQIKDFEEDFNFICDVCASDPDITISISTLEGGRYRVVVTSACPNCFNAIKTTVVTTDISNLYDRVNVAKLRWREALSSKQDEEENLIGE